MAKTILVIDDHQDFLLALCTAADLKFGSDKCPWNPILTIIGQEKRLDDGISGDQRRDQAIIGHVIVWRLPCPIKDLAVNAVKSGQMNWA